MWSPLHTLQKNLPPIENSITQLRPVLGVSNKDKNGHSLNDKLEKDPDLIKLLPLGLTNLRKYPHGVSADIEKAFL